MKAFRAYLQDELQRFSNERYAHGSGGERAGGARVPAAEYVSLPELHGHQEEQNGKRHGAQERGQQCAHNHGEAFRCSSVCDCASGVRSRSFYRRPGPSPPSDKLVHAKFIFNCGCRSAPPPTCAGRRASPFVPGAASLVPTSCCTHTIRGGFH